MFRLLFSKLMAALFLVLFASSTVQAAPRGCPSGQSLIGKDPAGNNVCQPTGQQRLVAVDANGRIPPIHVSDESWSRSGFRGTYFRDGAAIAINVSYLRFLSGDIKVLYELADCQGNAYVSLLKGTPTTIISPLLAFANNTLYQIDPTVADPIAINSSVQSFGNGTYGNGNCVNVEPSTFIAHPTTIVAADVFALPLHLEVR